MAKPTDERFSSQAAPEVRDEALRDCIGRPQTDRPRCSLKAAFAASLEEFDSLYRELAK